MRILFFGLYNPTYSRNSVLLEGLKSQGVEVLQCRTNSGPGWPFRLLFNYWKLAENYDVMIVGFPGQEVMFLGRLLTRKPIVFDAFTSHFGGYILDRKRADPTSWRSYWLKFLDRWSCKLADIVLLDTNAHIDFFVKEFNLPRYKFRRLLVGSNSQIFFPGQAGQEQKKYLVHFHGYFSPMHGVEYIVRAAKILESEGMDFNIVGEGQTQAEVLSIVERLNIRNINFIPPVTHQRLAELIRKADVCLGIFGTSPKTALVIPNKVYEAIACARPVITADTPAIREVFQDGENIFLCKAGDEYDLAQTIKRLRQDSTKTLLVAKRGYELFKKQLSEQIIGRQLVYIISDLRIHT